MKSNSVRVSVAQAKSHLSSLLRTLGDHSVIIHNRGKTVALIIAANDESSDQPEKPFEKFFRQMEKTRQRHGIQGVNFRPGKAKLRREEVRF